MIKSYDYELRKRDVLIYVVVFVFLVSYWLKSLVLGIYLQNGLVNFWRNLYFEYTCDYDVEDCFFIVCGEVEYVFFFFIVLCENMIGMRRKVEIESFSKYVREYRQFSEIIVEIFFLVSFV